MNACCGTVSCSKQIEWIDFIVQQKPYLLWSKRELPYSADDLDAQSHASMPEWSPPMVKWDKWPPSWPVARVVCANPPPLWISNTFDELSRPLEAPSGLRSLTSDAFGTDGMHFAASGHHSHRQFVHDQNAPLEITRFRCIFCGLQSNHLVHNLCNGKYVYFDFHMASTDWQNRNRKRNGVSAVSTSQRIYASQSTHDVRLITTMHIRISTQVRRGHKKSIIFFSLLSLLLLTTSALMSIDSTKFHHHNINNHRQSIRLHLTFNAIWFFVKEKRQFFCDQNVRNRFLGFLRAFTMLCKAWNCIWLALFWNFRTYSGQLGLWVPSWMRSAFFLKWKLFIF